jgi:hypothetical protein
MIERGWAGGVGRWCRLRPMGVEGGRTVLGGPAAVQIRRGVEASRRDGAFGSEMTVVHLGGADMADGLNDKIDSQIPFCLKGECRVTKIPGLRGRTFQIPHRSGCLGPFDR